MPSAATASPTPGRSCAPTSPAAWQTRPPPPPRRVEGMDYPDFSEEFMASHLAEKVLEPDVVAGERYDYLSALFSIDHQHHVDPNPENLVHRLVRLPHRLGRILAAVERSQRRDQTLVAIVSDHGSEYQPGAINLAWPIPRMLRTRALR